MSAQVYGPDFLRNLKLAEPHEKPTVDACADMLEKQIEKLQVQGAERDRYREALERISMGNFVDACDAETIATEAMRTLAVDGRHNSPKKDHTK